jgi:pentafunctional AROM polypeptide
MFELLSLGLRTGVEVVDVEALWDPNQTNHLLTQAEERYSSLMLGSHHVVGHAVDTEQAVEIFEKCALNGRSHGVKVVLSIETEDQDRTAYEAALIASELAAKENRPVVPHIALALGQVGQFSRVINLPFTPVTHENLPVCITQEISALDGCCVYLTI